MNYSNDYLKWRDRYYHGRPAFLRPLWYFFFLRSLRYSWRWAFRVWLRTWVVR